MRLEGIQDSTASYNKIPFLPLAFSWFDLTTVLIFYHVPLLELGELFDIYFSIGFFSNLLSPAALKNSNSQVTVHRHVT